MNLEIRLLAELKKYKTTKANPRGDFGKFYPMWGILE